MAKMKIKPQHSTSSDWKSLHIKKEPEEFPLHVVSVKTEDNEDEYEIHHRVTEENREEPDGKEGAAAAHQQLKTEEKESGAHLDQRWEWEAPLKQNHRRTGSTMEPKADLPLVKQGPHVKPEPEEFHMVMVKTEDDKHESELDHREEPSGSSSSDTDLSDDYNQDRTPVKRSYAMIPSDSRPHDHCPFTCSECGLKFRWKSHLETHAAVHTSFACFVCQKGFARKCNLYEHLKHVHFTCPVCEERFEFKASLMMHLKTPHVEGTGPDHKPYRCEDCGMTFRWISALKKHTMTHTRAMRFFCSFCQKGFRDRFSLTAHIRIHTGEEPYVCHVCNKGYKEKSILHAHLKKVHHICPVCKERFRGKNDLKSHLRTHVEEGVLDRSVLEIHSCSVCAAEFDIKSKLQRHMLVHTGERPHKCCLCDKSYLQRGHLTQHLESHSTDRPHTCALCGKSFKIKAAFKVHMRTHLPERPFPCPQCDRSYPLKHKLQEHMISHSRERPFTCSVCEKAFKTKSNLVKHLKTHLEDRYMCTVCGKGFNKRCNLSRHRKMQNHVRNSEDERLEQLNKPFCCLHCNKRFNRKSKLETHQELHTQQETRSYNVEVHSLRKIHSCSSEVQSQHEAHKCLACDKGFMQKVDLENHVRLYCGEKSQDGCVTE